MNVLRITLSGCQLTGLPEVWKRGGGQQIRPYLEGPTKKDGPLILSRCVACLITWNVMKTSARAAIERAKAVMDS